MRKPHRLLRESNYKRSTLLLPVSFLLPLLLLLFFFISAIAPPRPRGAADVRTPPPPRFAYMISGSSGDLPRVRRLLMAIYHPWNCYLVRLDLESERRTFAEFLKREKVIKDFGNVRLVEGVGPVSSKGPTEIAAMLQGIAILLREFKDWNWFVNLSASDYPLLPQDGMFPSLGQSFFRLSSPSQDGVFPFLGCYYASNIIQYHNWISSLLLPLDMQCVCQPNSVTLVKKPVV